MHAWYGAFWNLSELVDVVVLVLVVVVIKAKYL